MKRNRRRIIVGREDNSALNRQDPRLLIVVCRNDADAFSANRDVDPYFADLLSGVKEADIPIEVLRCSVDANEMRAEHVIPFR